MQQRLNIALVHAEDARNVRTSSGTLYFSKHSFQRKIGDVVDLTPAPMNLLPYKIATRLIGLTGKSYCYEQDVALARRYGRYFSGLLARGKYDLIFSACSASSVAFLETDVPIIYYTDITWPLARNYYGCYTNVTGRTDRGGYELDRLSLEKASIVLLPSHWAAESAVRDHGIDPGKIHVLYLGANLMQPPSRQQVLPRTLGRRIRLLLVGVNWEIKGGQIALDALVRLLEMGIDAELTVVGCNAPEGVSHPRMKVIPFLNKQIPAEREQFERLWYDADFFILPTRYEAAGLVFCEASAYGLPSIGTYTGGIPSLIREGKNGYTVPHDAGGARYAEIIAGLASDPERYSRLCQSSRDEFETRLNWDSWGEGVARAIGEHFPHLRDRLPIIEESYKLPLYG
jgi:glycosyltransferase involved in cell wall biosynthesis